MSCTQRCNQGRSCACSYRSQFNHIGELRKPASFTVADRVTFVLLMIVIIGFIGGAFA